MTIGEMLKLDIEEYAAHCRGNSRLFQLAQRGQLTPKAIATYLAGLLHLMRHAEPMLNLARKRSEELGNEKLADFFKNKAKEEKGHDLWAEADASTLGAMFGVALPATAPSIVSLLDYLQQIIIEEPSQLLAYIVFTEYFTVIMGPEWLQMLEERCGIPMVALTVVDKHVETDKHHAAEILREVDELVECQNGVELLRTALRTSIGYFDGFCNEISLAA